jgi:hypothetical protein
MIAHSTPFTVKPSIKLLAKRIIMAFITSKKRPSVTIVTGKVRITKIGLTIKFRRLKTMATIIAVI